MTARSAEAAPDRGRTSDTRREGVIRRILERQRSGAAMNSRAVHRDDGKLAYAGWRRYRNWAAALPAVGIDPSEVALQHTWTGPQVIAAIKKLGRQGVALNTKNIARTDRRVYQAGCKLFDGWDGVLRAAGHEPAKIRLQRRPWTKSKVVDLIVAHLKSGRHLRPYSLRPISASMAIPRLFGSFKSALGAACAVHLVRKHPPWSNASVIDAIKYRHRSGAPMDYVAVTRDAPKLVRAAYHRFDHWAAALAAAGLNPREHVQRYPAWTPEGVLDEIRRQIKTGELAVPSWHIRPVTLVRSAKIFFGSLDRAVIAATGKPRVSPPFEWWTRDRVVRTIRDAHTAGKPINYTAFGKGTTPEAGRRLFGSWDGALLAAGFAPEAVRINRKPWTRGTVQQEIKRRHLTGEPLNAGRMPVALHRAGRVFFGSWDAALASSGLDPAQIRKRRPRQPR